MARPKQVSRTMTETTIIGGLLSYDKETGSANVVELEPIVIVNEGVDEDKAHKLLKKTYGKNQNYVVISVETIERTYAMSLENFLAMAEEI